MPLSFWWLLRVADTRNWISGEIHGGAESGELILDSLKCGGCVTSGREEQTGMENGSSSGRL